MGGNAAAGEESEHPNSVLISISSDREEASVHGAVVVVMGNFKRLVIERDRDFTPEHEPSLPLSPHQSHDPESHSKRLTVVRVFCKADTNLVLTIRDSQVILAQVDPSNEYQQWYKEEKFSTRVKDEYGFPSFALVNKATGQALKHSIGATHPVQLIAYKADEVDTSILWSQGCLKVDGYRSFRMVNNTRLSLDAFMGDESVRDGSIIVLWKWKNGDNQKWKIVPF